MLKKSEISKSKNNSAYYRPYPVYAYALGVNIHKKPAQNIS